MKLHPGVQRRGAAIVGLMIVAVILLGSLLLLNTAAMVTVANTSRALEIARQDTGLALRLERITREAGLRAYGVAVRDTSSTLGTEIAQVIAAGSFGAATLKDRTIVELPGSPAWFPSLWQEPEPLLAPSQELRILSTPGLDRLFRARGRDSVTESAPLRVEYTFDRPNAAGSVGEIRIAVEGRLVSVPLTRHGLVGYELPGEIGRRVDRMHGPSHVAAADLGPSGLVPARDPAGVSVLERRIPGAAWDNRPGHYRFLAAMSDAYQYVFSDQYLQRVADYAGVTHFVVVGAAAANPSLDGGAEEGTSYELDVGALGPARLGATGATRNAAVFCFPTPGGRLVLSDSGVGGEPVLILVCGPAGVGATGSAELNLATSIVRPVVIVGYNITLTGIAGGSVNGALFLDPDCSVSAATGPFTVGHLSHAAGGAVSTDAFRIQPMPPAAELLAPKVVYVATRSTVL